MQDGARARITEELIVKFIHSEGVSTQGEPKDGAAAPGPLFADRGQISFRFLGALARLCAGLEVEGNRLWEWEDAILAGSELFRRLRAEGQGTVSMDLDARRLEFSSDVYVDFPGGVADIGSAAFVQGAADAGHAPEGAVEVCAKAAILDALGFRGSVPAQDGGLQVRLADRRRPSVKATGTVQEAMWRRRIVSFKLAWSGDGARRFCTAFALSDPTGPAA